MPDNLNARCWSQSRKKQRTVSPQTVFFEQNAQTVVDTAKAIAAVYLGGVKMLSMDNGGSSCDTSHFAVEFRHPITAERTALPVINLIMDTAILSAVCNDVGFKHIFVHQLEAHAKAGHGLIGADVRMVV